MAADSPSQGTWAARSTVPSAVRRGAAGVLGLLVLALVLAVAGRVVDDPRVSATGWLAIAAAAVLLLVLEGPALRWRRRVDSGAARLGWTLLTLAAAMLMVAVLVAAFLYDYRDYRHVVMDVGYFAASPVFAVGILTLPTPSFRDGWEAALDLLTGLAAAAGVAVGTLWLLPDDPAHGLSPDEVAHWAAVAGTVGVLVFAVARQRRPGGLSVRQLELVMLATALVTAGSVASYRASVGQTSFGWAQAAAWFVAGCTVGMLAVVRPSVEAEGPRELRRRELWATLLPAVAMVAGLASLAWYATQPIPIPFVLGGVMALLVLVFVIVYLAVQVLSAQQARRLRLAAASQELESVALDAWFRVMTADIADAVVLVDLSGVVVISSPAADRLFGPSLAGSPLEDRIADDGPTWRRLLAEAAASPDRVATSEMSVRTGGSGRVPVEVTATAMTELGGLKGYVVTVRDLSERDHLATVLAEQQMTDALTGLPNRAGFLAAAAVRLENGDPEGTVLVVLDLDRFGIVNDTQGHATGDVLLRRVADLVQACAECGGVAVGRVGGDEFAVLLVPGGDQDGLDATVDASVAHLRGLLDGLSAIRGDGLPMTCHAGYAVGSPGLRADALLRRAEVAVETARRQAAIEPVRFSPAEHAARLADVGLEADLRAAIAAGALLLHYQPQVELRSGRIVGAEALVRWPRPTGLVGPDRFVPLAERSGLAADLGDWVIRRALADLPALRAAAGDDAFRVSVNVSAREVTGRLPTSIRAALRECHARPVDVILEVTESALFAQPAEAGPALQALRDEGITVALDDFGTGYSSLALLTRVPVDVLKIDRGFVSLVEHQGQEWALVRGVLQLCQGLRLRSVAEGVETAAQADLLRAMGCDEAQGYLFTRPLPVEDACAWMRERRSASSTLRG